MTGSRAWSGTSARTRGRAGVKRRRLLLRLHDGICHVCGLPGADEVDHVIPLARGGADSIENMRPIHAEPCHAEKTKLEAAAGRGGGARRRREPEAHPGLIP